MSNDPILSALVETLEEATTLLRSKPPSWSQTKAHQDFVTDIDLELDAFLQARLSDLTPGAPVLSEERAAERMSPQDLWWIVDPLDGTGNLIAGLPFVGIAVALIDARGPRLAAVAAPYQQLIWSAERGVGAWANGSALRIPDRPPALLVASTGLLDHILAEADGNRWLTLRSQGKIRNLGAQSLHLCGVAQGWFAAALSIEARIWDEAAGGLILREAGGLWRSSADAADWSDPSTLMAMPQQNSLACHPDVQTALAEIIPAPVATSVREGR